MTTDIMINDLKILRNEYLYNIIYTTTVQNRVKILNENTQKYLNVPIVETLGGVVDLGDVRS